MATHKYILKEGVEIRPFGSGSLIEKHTLTDEIAEYLIETGRATKEDFEPIKKEKQ